MRPSLALLAALAPFLAARAQGPRAPLPGPADTLSPHEVRVACGHPLVRRRTIDDVDRLPTDAEAQLRGRAFVEGNRIDSGRVRALYDSVRPMLYLCDGLRMPGDLSSLTVGHLNRFGRVIGQLPGVAHVKAFAAKTREADAARVRVFRDTTAGKLASYFAGGDALTRADSLRLEAFAIELGRFMRLNPEDTLAIVMLMESDSAGLARRQRIDRQLARIQEIFARHAADGLELSRFNTLRCIRGAGTPTRASRACGDDVHLRVAGADSLLYELSSGVSIVAGAAGVRSPEIQAAAAYTPASVSQSGSALSAPTVTAAVADAVIAQVRSEIETGLLTTALDRLCALRLGNSSVSELVPRTCRLKDVVALTPLSVQAIRATARVDMRESPTRLVGLALRDPTVLNAQRYGEELVTLAFTLHTLQSAPRDVWGFVESFPDWIERLSVSKSVQDRDVIRGLTAVAGFARLLRSDMGNVPLARGGYRGVLADRIENTLKAYAVMVMDPASQPAWKTRATVNLATNGDIARLYANVASIAELQPAIDTLVRTGRLNDPTLLVNLAQVAMSAIDAGQPDTARMARIQNLATTALELHQLARADRWREMLMRVDQLGRSDELGFTFSAEWRRVVSFTVELAEAREGKEVNAAVRSFVQKGKGYRAKRLPVLDPTPTADTVVKDGMIRVEAKGRMAGLDAKIRTRQYLTLNAYLSYVGSVDDRGGDLDQRLALAPYLPIGLEWGLRPKRSSLPVPKSDKSYGLYLQIADIGAIGAARLSNDDAVVNSATYAQVFSPGLHIVRSWGASIAATSLGVVLGREAWEASGRRRNTVRYQFMLAGFDVPLFP